MRIYVQEYGGVDYGRPLEIDAEASDTIDNVKLKIEDLFPQRPPCSQRLTHDIRCLELGRTLSDYNILKDSTLRLTYPRGLFGSHNVVQHDELVVSSTPLPLEDDVALKPTLAVTFGMSPSLCSEKSFSRRPRPASCSPRCPFRPFPVDLNWYCGACKCERFKNEIPLFFFF